MAEPEPAADRRVWRELIVHAFAFCIAAAIGAMVVSRYYAIFEHDTDTASEARSAFLTAVAITGCAGPGVSLLLFWFARLITRRR